MDIVLEGFFMFHSLTPISLFNSNDSSNTSYEENNTLFYLFDLSEIILSAETELNLFEVAPPASAPAPAINNLSPKARPLSTQIRKRHSLWQRKL